MDYKEITTHSGTPTSPSYFPTREICKSGGIKLEGCAPPHFLGASREYTRALAQTLAEVRTLRDQLLTDDLCFQAGLVLGQIGLVLERLRHGIASDREAFTALLRAAGLAERDNVEVGLCK